MSDDYLWDGSGEPDPEIQKLEETLRALRSTRPAPTFPQTLRVTLPRTHGDPPGPPVPRAHAALAIGRAQSRRRWMVSALAAAAVVIIATAWIALRRPAALGGDAWEVASLSGSPTIGAGDRGSAAAGREATRAVAAGGSSTLGVGEWLETDASSRARLAVASIGEVVVEPETRLRLVATNRLEHRLELARGTMHAWISAPPRLFLVDTPSARAVDLGCAYTLEVTPSGAGMLSVQTGWVSFEREGRESYVPAGARCFTRPGTGPGSGPGTPYFDDAPEPLRKALATFDFDRAGGDALAMEREGTERRQALATVLTSARPRDALTLWHLLGRLEGAERTAVYERMAALAPPPAGVTREGIAGGDRAMLDRWWEDLGYGRGFWGRAWDRVTN